MTAPSTRGRYAKGEARLEDILTRALQTFDEVGYRGTSMREIARRSGLSQAGLLHYFGSKEELFVALLRDRQERDVRDYHGETDAVGSLIEAVRHNATVPGLVRLYTTLAVEAANGDETARAYFVERYDLARLLVRAAVVRAQEDGEAHPGLDPAIAAQTLLAVADGMQIQWLLDPAVDMATPVETVWRLMAAPAAGGD
jgi:AcrR family transcriptional regulator